MHYAVRYTGEWTNGKINGKGSTIVFPDISIHFLIFSFVGTIYLISGDKYVGDWKDGRRHGSGTYFYRYA